MCNDKVSIIVPIYNAQKWLDQCITSVLHQTYKHIELILVDDGSTDASLEICEKYKNSDSRVVVIHKSNSGVSDTRNVGIHHATGAYMMFLDSDDFLDEMMVQSAVDLQKETECGFIGVNFALVIDGKKHLEPDFYGNHISIKQLRKNIISAYHDNFNIGNYARAVIGKLFLSHIIKSNHIRFDKDIYIGEDALFILEYTKYISNAQFIGSHLYNYRILASSAVRKYKKDLIDQSHKQLEWIIVFLNDNQLQNKDFMTSLTVLSWTLFRDNLKNDRKADQKTYDNTIKWFKERKTILCNKDIHYNELPNITKVQYTLSRFIPIRLLCDITRLYYDVRK